MGGSQQNTCSPAPSTATPRKGKSAVKPASSNPIRYHEVTSRGEVDFHDELAGFKCAVDSAAFFAAYTPWRSKMSEELTLSGQLVKTGVKRASGHASVTFMPYVDDAGEMQVGMVVAETKIGQTVLDLDKLANYP